MAIHQTELRWAWWMIVTSLLLVLLIPVRVGATHATPEWTDHNDSDPGITLKKPPAEAKGEKGGTVDINIGVGELWEDEHNETDLALLRERARRLHETRARGLVVR